MIPIAKPFLGIEEAKAAQEVILSGWVTQGPKVTAFEEAFTETVGARHACAVSSGTTALHLALLAVGVKPGDVVITVSHSFIATANAVRYCGAEPVFIDIEPGTYNMDPNELLRVLVEDCTRRDNELYYNDIERVAVGESPLKYLNNKAYPAGRVAAIMPVHQMGIPCDMPSINRTANRYNLPVVEDAACAVGSELSLDAGATWEKVGKPHGNIACFSFHPRKLITTGEGGMISTNDNELDQKCRLLRQHGMSITDTARHVSSSVIFERYLMTGFNYRLSDMQAAIGIEQLKKLAAMLSERNRLAMLYRKLLGEIPCIRLLNPADNALTNWQSYPVQLTDECPLSQSEIMERLLKKGISARRGIMNAHQEPPFEAAGWSLPHSEKSRDKTILLPLFNGLSLEDIKYVASNLKEILS